ncbi:MAG: hypothetical protein AAF245_14220, partial [Pseudomonadota bacterium]
PADWPDVPRFAVVRAPKARFLSAVRMFKFGVAEPDDFYHTPALPDLTLSQALDILEDPAVPYDRTYRTPLANLKHHLLPQTHPFQCLDAATDILRFEHLAEDFAAFATQIGLRQTLPHVRKGSSRQDALSFTPEEEARFHALFADDYRLLGYDEAETQVRPIGSFPARPATLPDLWPAIFSDRKISIEEGAAALPAVDVPLPLFTRTPLPGPPGQTWAGRKPDLPQHFKALAGEFRGSSYLAYLVACTMVVVRRAKDDTTRDHALALFQRCLDERHETLWPALNLRWLTSVADTLVDHGTTPQVRALAGAATLLANTAKLAETERAFYHPAPTWPPRHRFRNRTALFDGVITYGTKRGDMIGNLGARVEDLAALDPVAGALLREVFRRIQTEDT